MCVQGQLLLYNVAKRINLQGVAGGAQGSQQVLADGGEPPEQAEGRVGGP